MNRSKMISRTPARRDRFLNVRPPNPGKTPNGGWFSDKANTKFGPILSIRYARLSSVRFLAPLPTLHFDLAEFFACGRILWIQT